MDDGDSGGDGNRNNGRGKKSSLFGFFNAKFNTKKKQPQSEVELLRARLRSKNLLKEPVREPHPLEVFFRQGAYRFFVGFLRAMRSKDTRTAANVFFGSVIKLSPEYFEPLKDALENSDMEVIPESYVGLMSSISFTCAAVVAALVTFESFYFGVSFWWMLLGVVALSSLAFFVTFTLAYMYPFQKVNAKRQNINANLPFAINHMAAIASSGVPPEKAFEMMAEFKEYGAVSVESRNLVRQIKAFGKDTLTAIRHTAANTPSKELKELLYGILSVIETGGNLKDYLNEMSQIALFNYQLARRKYIEALSTYADIYTAILIAAPLFLVSILAVMNIVPGGLVGSISIESFMKLGVYVIIPGMNIGFLLFISYTQPEM